MIRIHTPAGEALPWTGARTEAMAWRKFVGSPAKASAHLSEGRRLGILLAQRAGYRARP